MDIENELSQGNEAPVEKKELVEERPPVKIEDGTVMEESREQERRIARELANRQDKDKNKGSNLTKADPTMFKTQQPAGRARNKTRVELCKAWIEAFDQDCHANAADASKRSLATNGLRNVFTSLDTLNRLDTKEILNHMVKVIESSNTGAWERRIVFANLKFLPESQRELLNRFLQLMTQYAEIEDKTKIRGKIDPGFAIGMYKDVETRTNIDSFFPQ